VERKKSAVAGETVQGQRRRVSRMKAPQQSLKAWTQQKWRTKSGKRSSDTGERYLPEAAIKALSPSEYARTTAVKRKGKAQGKQFVAQPKGVKEKVRPYRRRGM
jgi:hypothetical protein